MTLTPTQFLTLKLTELQQHSAAELPKAATAPAHTAARIYSRIKLTCGVIDTFQSLSLHTLTPPQQTAYLIFREQSWQTITALDTTPAPIAANLIYLIKEFLTHFNN